MLIVLAILSIVAVLALGYQGAAIGKARMAAAREELEFLGEAIDTYREDVLVLPTTHQGLDVLVTNPGRPSWRGPYAMRSHLVDPWGRSYLYARHGMSYDLYTLGRDGIRGGSGEDADIMEYQPF